MGDVQFHRKDAARAKSKRHRIPQSPPAQEKRNSAARVCNPSTRRDFGRRLLVFWGLAFQWNALPVSQGRAAPRSTTQLGDARIDVARARGGLEDPIFKRRARPKRFAGSLQPTRSRAAYVSGTGDVLGECWARSSNSNRSASRPLRVDTCNQGAVQPCKTPGL